MNIKYKIIGITEFIVSTILQGIFAVSLAAIIIIMFAACMGVFMLLPGYLFERGHWIIGSVYTLFVWGIAWRLMK